MLSFIRNIKNRIKEKPKLDTHWEIPLPKSILQHTLFGYLELDEAAILAKASTPFAESCQKQFEIARLLEHVVRGEQDEVEAMLQKDRSLLLQKSHVTDLSGRKFYQITAFQYALWALDRHMWEMLLKYLPENEAGNQLEELETTGVEYVRLVSECEYGHKVEKQTKTEKHHFDFSQLIVSLCDYVDFYHIRNWDQSSYIWRNKVGGAQRNVPAHVAQEYCRLDRAFYPVPEFKETTLSRNFNFYNLVTGTNTPWFSGLSSSFPLSFQFALCRGRALGWDETARLDTCADRKDASDDLEAITALCKVRTNEFEILKDRLLKKAITLVSLRRGQ